jgi:hypothetical protein
MWHIFAHSLFLPRETLFAMSINTTTEKTAVVHPVIVPVLYCYCWRHGG